MHWEEFVENWERWQHVWVLWSIGDKETVEAWAKGRNSTKKIVNQSPRIELGTEGVWRKLEDSANIVHSSLTITSVWPINKSCCVTNTGLDNQHLITLICERFSISENSKPLTLSLYCRWQNTIFQSLMHSFKYICICISVRTHTLSFLNYPEYFAKN